MFGQVPVLVSCLPLCIGCHFSIFYLAHTCAEVKPLPTFFSLLSFQPKGPFQVQGGCACQFWELNRMPPQTSFYVCSLRLPLPTKVLAVKALYHYWKVESVL